jgi:malate dehydrogenase (oxaloacetate-decarboxylating)
LLEPSFGGITLEDIASPKCFEVLEKACSKLSIPVWHDDQQGTATVILAGLINAFKIVGKKPQTANRSGRSGAATPEPRMSLSAGR